MSERKTENLVRDALRNLNYYQDTKITIEEQKSDNPRINKLLLHASKKGKGAGYPEFIIRSANYPNFLIVIECKADNRKHESQNRDKYDDYAVDGALLYASHLSAQYDVIAIGVSGKNVSEMRISHFLFLKKDKNYVSILDDKLLTFENYYKSYIHHPKKFNQDYRELLDYSQELNETLHAKKIKESQRSLLISGILIALQNQAFHKAFKEHNTAKQLSNNLVQTVVNELSNGSVPEAKIRNLNHAYSFIQTHATLSTDKEFFINLIEEIDEKINSFIRTHQYFDTIGQFYIEFLRYANNDKGLGIVLTPPHITGLFADLAETNKESVVIDNCCGTAGFLISALQKMIKTAREDEEKINHIKTNQLIGIEFQDDIYALAVSNMIIHGDGKSNIYQGDCFQHVGQIKKKYSPTIGLLNPPYKTKKSDVEEIEFVLNNLQYLQQNGKCVAIVPMSCMIGNTKTQVELKKRILRSHTVEAVMSAPEDLFHSSKINMVTAIIVITAHVPHPKGKKTWFGYWRDDGFVKVKKKGRVDLNHKWEQIKKEWLNSFNNREEKEYASIMKEVGPGDEWCAEAYLKTDYSLLNEKKFKQSVEQYLAFRLLYNLLEFKTNQVRCKNKTSDPNNVVPIDTLFYVYNGLPSDQVEIFDEPEDENSIRYLRPSQSYQGSIAGFVDPSSVEDRYIYPENTIYVSTDGQGSHTYSYVSSFEFIPNSNVAVLIPKADMSLNEKLYYALCISLNRFKFSYGRKPKGERLKKLLIPANPPAFVYKDIFDEILRGWRRIFQ